MPSSHATSEHAARDERDVLTRDREQVVEARGTKRVPQVFVEPFVLAEHDPEQHGTPLAGDARRECGGDRSPEPVSDAAEPSPAADDLWIATSEDHVDAVAPKPRALVEAVVAGPRLGHEDRKLEDRALGRRAAHRELEQDRLAHVAVAEAIDACGYAERELRSASRPGDRHAGDGGTPDLGRHRAPVDRLEPQRAPPAPASTSPIASSANRARGSAAARAAAATASRGTVAVSTRTALEDAMPAQSPASRRCGTWPDSFSITAPPAREAPRSSPARCRARHRAPRPTERHRARCGDPGSSGRSPVRPRAACRAARVSPRSG